MNGTKNAFTGAGDPYKNGLSDDEKPDADKVKEYERRYRETLGKAKEEYEYIPPDKCYRDGYNLYRRMEEYMSNHLLFLHDRLEGTCNK